MVLINLHVTVIASRELSFPSPCGDYGSYQASAAALLSSEVVSVPLRGLWFLSLCSITCKLFIFSPFPSPCGDYGSYPFVCRHASNMTHASFPSPCGDYGSYLRDPVGGSSVNLIEFPSPCGDYGSYRWIGRDKASRTASFPSPCGDYGSYRFLDFLLCFSLEGGFRPLAGIMVLIRTLYRWLYEAVEMAFCGADHIFSSFFVFCKKMIFKKLLRIEF